MATMTRTRKSCTAAIVSMRSTCPTQRTGVNKIDWIGNVKQIINAEVFRRRYRVHTVHLPVPTESQDRNKKNMKVETCNCGGVRGCEGVRRSAAEQTQGPHKL